MQSDAGRHLELLRRIEMLEQENALLKRQIGEGAPAAETLFQAAFNAMPAHIAVLDRTGAIIAVNHAWKRFAEENDSQWPTVKDGPVNYLEVCQQAPELPGGDIASQVAKGISEVIDGTRSEYRQYYTCDSPDDKRWFHVHVSRLDEPYGGVVVSHLNVTEQKRAEERLLAVQEQYELIQDATLDGIWDWNMQSGRVVYSPQCLRLLDFAEPLPERIGTFCELVHPDDRLENDRLLREHSEDLIPFKQNEIRMRTGSGAYRWFLHRCKIVARDDAQRPLRMVGTISDISERKMAEAHRTEALSRLQKIADRLPCIVYQFRKKPDGQTCFPYASERMREIYGLGPEEVKEDVAKLFALHHPEDSERILQSIQQSEASLAAWCLEFRICLADGTVKWLLGSSMPEREPDGGILWHGFVADISHHKQAEDALRESESRWKFAIEGTGVGLLDWSLPDDSIYLSPRVFDMLGYHPERVEELLALGQKLHADEFPQLRSLVATHLAGEGNGQVYEHRIQCKDGQWRWFQSRGMVMHRDEKGQPLRWIGILSDMTEQKRAEEERNRLVAQLTHSQRMDSVGRLAGGIAHDFNNMLGIILGHTELAMKRATELQLADLIPIQKAASRSAELTRQLLAFARKQTVLPRVIDLNQVVAEMLKILPRLLGEDIQVVWSPAKGLKSILMDPTQVEQILTNLCVNARDAIAGIGRIEIETADHTITSSDCSEFSEAVPGDYVRLTVRDNGKGIDAASIDRIFEPFYTTKEGGMGTGLGLSTVYGAVRQNNGFLKVESQPGQGSVFQIIIPSCAHSSKGVRQVASPSRSLSGHETILIVEDETALLTLSKLLLQSKGYYVLCAASPHDAIRIAEAHREDLQLVVTDVIMPQMNGRQLVERLREVIPHLRCLFMSGYTADVIENRGSLEPGTHFIQKPFTADQLRHMVRDVLDEPIDVGSQGIVPDN